MSTNMKKNGNAKEPKSEPPAGFKVEMPNGGWGWFIVMGQALANIVSIPLLQNFGLLFRDRFKELGFDPTEITTLMTLNSAYGMIMGIFNALLLGWLGYRKLAIIAIFLLNVGFLLTGLANSYIQFVIAWGIIASHGVMTQMTCFSQAMNIFFRGEKRRYASSVSTFLTGLGPIVMPLLINELITSYGSVKWVVFILTAVNLNSFVGAALLRPVKWYTKLVPVNPTESLQEKDEEEEEEFPIQQPDTNVLCDHELISSRKNSLRFNRSCSLVSNAKSQTSLTSVKFFASQEVLKRKSWSEKVGINNNEKRQRSITCLDNVDYGFMRSNMYIPENSLKDKTRYVALASTENFDDLNVDRSLEKSASSPKIPSGVGSPLLKDVPREEEEDVEKEGNEVMGKVESKTQDEESDKLPWYSRVLNSVVNFIRSKYDIGLLQDPIYWNILIGLSIAIVGEMVFSLLTPLILEEFGLDLDQTAKFMSVVATTDLAFRLIAPIIGRLLKQKSRMMYICALFLLVVTRLSTFATTDYLGLLFVAGGLGIGKGFRTVYWVLVIPEYVDKVLEEQQSVSWDLKSKKMASAAAFQSLANGLFFLSSGPIIGAIITVYGKYSYLIYISNLLTVTTILMWSIEFIVVWYRNKKKEKNLPKPIS